MPTLSPLGLLDRFMHGPVHRASQTQPVLPLQGITILAVEDSRFASDAVRLLCQRSGARLRRVDTLTAAYAHLRVYRPDVMLVDMGLPDGRGDSLIRDLAQAQTQGQRPIVIAISGDPAARTEAISAGADGFVDKPFPSLLAFQTEILRHLPDCADRTPAQVTYAPITPDPLALQDDLERAAGMIGANPTEQQRRYLAGFVTGIARIANDAALALAAQNLKDANGVDQLCQLLATRIDTRKNHFNATAG